MGAPDPVALRPARAEDARILADIHMIARREATPYAVSPYGPAQTYAWFETGVIDAAVAWWVAERSGVIVGYIKMTPKQLDHLYVLPVHQGLGIGARLLDHAKTLSAGRLGLFCFARNAQARRFYEARGFRAVAFRDGSQNDEHEPDVVYEWTAPPR